MWRRGQTNATAPWRFIVCLSFSFPFCYRRLIIISPELLYLIAVQGKAYLARLHGGGYTNPLQSCNCVARGEKEAE